MIFCSNCDSEALWKITHHDNKGVMTPMCDSCRIAYEWGQASPESSVEEIGDGDEDQTIYVDVPNPECGPEASWINVRTFTNVNDALNFIRENIGPCDDHGNVCLLSNVGRDKTPMGGVSEDDEVDHEGTGCGRSDFEGDTEASEPEAKSYKLYICGNDETLTDGYFLSVGNDLRDEANEMFQAGIAVLLDAESSTETPSAVDYEINSTFQDWHGGRHSGSPSHSEGCGYANGFVSCREEHVPEWLISLMDKMSDAVSTKGSELGRQQTAQLAQDVIKCVENEDEPSQFVIENISREELNPELLVKFETACEKWTETKEQREDQENNDA